MRRLILTRHAKSDWGDPRLDDHDRPLNARGRGAAPRVGRWLAAAGLRPGVVLSSTARRTRETWAGMAPELGGAPQVAWLPALYHGAPTAMLAALRAADDRAETVLMIGHNPGIAEFAALMAAAPPAHPRFADYPTAATAVIEFPADGWAGVAPGTGRVAAFTVPRDLE